MLQVADVIYLESERDDLSTCGGKYMEAHHIYLDLTVVVSAKFDSHSTH